MFRLFLGQNLPSIGGGGQNLGFLYYVICGQPLRNKEVISEVLKKGGTSFLSLAQPFDKHRSAADHDVEDQKTSKSQESKRPKGRRLPCFAFQRGDCKFRGCKFSHLCSLCGSNRHGGHACPRKRQKSNSSRPARNSSASRRRQ